MDKENKEVQKHFNKGLDALDDGNWIMAVQQFRKCLELDPGYSSAYHEIADIYYNNGQLDAAVDVLKQAIVRDPDDIEANFALGSIYNAQGKYTEALRLFKRLEQDSGDYSPELYYNMGIAYKNLNFPILALDYLNLALEEDPSYFECLEAIGKIQLDAGKYEDARKAFTDALESDPGNINLHHMLGMAFSRDNMWTEAIAEWETVLKLAPEQPEQAEALRELGWALSMAGEYEKAVSALRKALEMNPHNLQARIDLGTVFMSKLKFEEAISEWEQAGKDDPANPLIKKYLSEAQDQKQKEGKGKD